MAQIESVPELADGGYWYHVPVETVESRGRVVQRPTLPVAASGYLAVHLGDGTAVIRSDVPLVGVQTVSMSAAAQLVRYESGTGRLARQPWRAGT